MNNPLARDRVVRPAPEGPVTSPTGKKFSPGPPILYRVRPVMGTCTLALAFSIAKWRQESCAIGL